MDLFAIRHGKIEWSLNGRHTGRTDTLDGKRLPLSGLRGADRGKIRSHSDEPAAARAGFLPGVGGEWLEHDDRHAGLFLATHRTRRDTAGLGEDDADTNGDDGVGDRRDHRTRAKMHYSIERLDEINSIFSRMRDDRIDGRVVMRV